MENSKKIGLLGELKAQYDFIKNGYEVSVPLGDYCSYDLIAIKDNIKLKIQVKTTEKIKDGKMEFHIKSKNYYVDKKYTEEDADIFYLYCLENETAYILPIKDAPSGGGWYLRTEPTKNNQVKGINFDYDYIFNKKLKEIEEGEQI